MISVKKTLYVHTIVNANQYSFSTFPAVATKQYDFEFQPTIIHKNRFFIYYLQLNFFLCENSAAFPRINGPEIHSTVTWSVSGKLDALNLFRRNKADASSATLGIK